MNIRKINLKKKKFGRLLFLKEEGRNKHNQIKCRCLCDCGNKTIVMKYNLQNGGTKSCGCLHKEKTREKTIERNRQGHSEETKKKISKAQEKRFKNPKNHPMFGKIHSKETKKKMSGKNHHNYNPNLTDTDRRDKRCYPEYKSWRSLVYERDNYTCQVCDKRGSKLIAHHLESYSINKKLRMFLDNGITLCKKCHLNFHHQFGNKNTKKQFEEFLRIKKNK